LRIDDTLSAIRTIELLIGGLPLETFDSPALEGQRRGSSHALKLSPGRVGTFPRTFAINIPEFLGGASGISETFSGTDIRAWTISFSGGLRPCRFLNSHLSSL
jgi:hypothetical protein